MNYIVTKSPATFIHYNWTIKDSKDGVLYPSFEEALASCKKIGGVGVVRLGN